METIKAIKYAFKTCKDRRTVDEMNGANIRAGLLMTPLIAVFELVMIIMTYHNIATGGSPVRVTYLQCYVILFASTLIALFLLALWRRAIEKNRRALMGLAHIYALLIILWAAAITFLDVSRGGQLIVYLTVLVVLAYVFYLHPWAVCIIFGGSAVLLMLLISRVTDHMFDITINLLVFAVFMIIASIMRYGNKKESVYREEVITEQNKELSELNEQLRILSQTDMLTRLYNRRYYDTTAPNIAQACAEKGQEFAAILIDIDKFKIVNDTYGHKAGDACIRFVAEIIMTESERYGGIAYRFGGEEFLVLIPDCGRNTAVELAENIRAKVEQTHLEEVECNVTVSLGCYAAKPESGEQAEAFVNKADHAMYRAKESGRNCVMAHNEKSLSEVVTNIAQKAENRLDNETKKA